MGKPYFYRLDAAEFIAAVFQIPEGAHKEWVSQLAIDLVAGEGTMDFSKKLIQEVADYRKKQSEAGKRGADVKRSKPKARRKQPLSDPKATPKQPNTDPQANSSSSKATAKNLYAENVSMTENEYQKLVEAHGQDKTSWMIQKLNEYKGANGKKYKSDYLAILNWVVEKAEKEFKPKESDWRNTYLAGY